MKIADWWGRNETFDSERFKSIKGNFSDGGNEKMRKWVNLVLIEFFQIGHNCVGKVFVKTYLKALRDFFPIYGISQYVIFLSNRRRKFKLLGLQGDPPPPQFPRLVRYPDLPMRKTLRVVCLLNIIIFFQRKKITECKIKDEKEETFFLFFDGVPSIWK